MKKRNVEIKRYVEVKGSIAKLSRLAKKHGFKYRPGDRVFRTPDGVLRAFRVIRGGKGTIINVQRVRTPAKHVKKAASRGSAFAVRRTSRLSLTGIGDSRGCLCG